MDLTGDGTPEIVRVTYDLFEGVANLDVLSRSPSGAKLIDRVQEFAPDPFETGTPEAHATVIAQDVTGDGILDALFCYSHAGANDYFTRFVVISFHNSVWSRVLDEAGVVNGELTVGNQQALVKETVDWGLGQCVEERTRRYTWSGSEFVLVGEDVEYDF
ncbi:MAG: hypothetical protein IH820_09700, partial [Bacteroidetes bacterium]|nr:hypothetical protein [Bacteroidota bacterium]